jgi:glycosyltransferase involved in cell wall biosynthesis
MKISGYSYIRNGFTYGYPFLKSIQSILPICDEFVIAVGDSTDGTREAIENLGSSKIRIIDTVWDENLRSSGKIFAQQANIALKEITGDYAFHIQADEIIHENDLNKIYEHIKELENNPQYEGLLFDFLNFYGNYNFLNNSRHQHKKEIRVFRNYMNVFAYRDSQGVRRYPSWDDYVNGHKGIKLKVKYINIPVYHYSHVRNPLTMHNKVKFFASFYYSDSDLEKKFQSKQEFDYYNSVDRVKPFDGVHPKLMEEVIAKENWPFDPSKVRKNLGIKKTLIYWIEAKLNHRFGEYKNYKIV